MRMDMLFRDRSNPASKKAKPGVILHTRRHALSAADHPRVCAAHHQAVRVHRHAGHAELRLHTGCATQRIASHRNAQEHEAGRDKHPCSVASINRAWQRCHFFCSGGGKGGGVRGWGRGGSAWQSLAKR